MLRGNHEVGQTDLFSCLPSPTHFFSPLHLQSGLGLRSFFIPGTARGQTLFILHPKLLAEEPGTENTSSLCVAVVPGMVNTML